MQDDAPRNVPPERWWRTRQITEQVMASTDEDLERVLQEACADDMDLISEVRALIEAASAYDAFSMETTGPGAPERGTRIGCYRLLQRIGEGGFGEVWMAEQVEPVQRSVAIKLIKPGMDSAQVIARFEAERQAIALMDHPNIARVLDAGSTDEGRPYFVMELVRGVLVTEYAQVAKLELRSRIELMRQVCSAVQHAHQKGVIHRDIKPSNVLVGEVDGKPVPKVIDFGVAKALERPLTDKTLFTEFRQFLGTPEYMSPEQASLSMMDVDTRSDVYSLGVLLYELLVGAPPFDPKSLRSAGFDEMRRIIREEEPLSPSDRLNRVRSSDSERARIDLLHAERRSRQVRGELDWIVQRAMEKERDRRYASASDLNDDLGRYLSGEPVAAGPVNVIYRARRFMRRHRAGVAVAVVLALLVLGFVGMLFWDNAQIRSARSETEVALHVAEERADEAEKQRAVAEALNDFLAGLLGAGVPSTGDGQGIDVSVREVLDIASDRVGEQFPEEPEVEAAVRLTLGNTFQLLGLDAKAEVHLRLALELMEANLGEGHPQTLNAAGNLSYLLIKTERFPEAEARIRKTIKLLESTTEADELDRLSEREGLAVVMKSTGRFEEAEAIYREVCEARREQLGDDDPATLNSFDNLAKLYRWMGRPSEATEFARKASDGRARVLGEDHPHTLQSMHHLSACLISQGAYEEAEDLLKRTSESAQEVFGPTHPRAIVVMSTLGDVYNHLGRYEDAEKALLSAAKGLEQGVGPGHYQTCVTYAQLATTYKSMGRLDEAESIMKRVLEQTTARRGVENGTRLSMAGSLARIYREQDRPEEALSLFEEIREIQVRVLGPEHPDTIRSKGDIADTYVDLGRLADAKKLMVERLEELRRIRGQEHPNVYHALHKLALVELKLENLESARAHAEPALAGFISVFGEGHVNTMYVREGMVEILHRLGELEEATELSERNSNVRERLLGPTDKLTVQSKRRLLQIYESRAEREPEGAWRDKAEALRVTLPTFVHAHPDLERIGR